jgi:acetylornithine/N-succinyldiaminopimelate aminotransferase
MQKDLNTLSTLEDKDFFHTYKRLKIIIERGEGCFLYTDKGNKILDMFGGLAVNVLGYNHHGVNEAIEKQVKRYLHVSNYFYQDTQIELAEKILEMSGFKKLFFSNSGTESTEGAIKLVRKFFKGTEKKTLVSFSGSFHGRTMGALSLTARKKYREDFGPFLADTKHLTFNSVDELKENIDEKTAAVFIEPIQGEGGVNIAGKDFINEIKELQKKYGFLIIADEIQSGVGRTGKLHGFEHFKLEPDIVTLAKGIGGGLPLGALLGNEKVADVFSYGDHGSTFGGSPVASASGNVVFNELKNGLIENARIRGDYLKQNLENLRQKYSDKIKEVRGIGLMVGIELKFDGQPVVEKMMEKDVLVNCTNGNVIRLLPPLIITEKEIDLFLGVFETVIK